MSSRPPLPPFAASLAAPFAAIVVAAGQGHRARQGVPKQFARWRGKPVLRHSVEALLAAGADPVLVAIAPGMEDEARAALTDLAQYRLVIGGATRRESVLNALETLAQDAATPGRVLIHDAARPTLPRAVIARVLAALDDAAGAIPVLPVVDSLVEAQGALMAAPADRGRMRRVQTPQGFRFAEILAAHRGWTGGAEAGDDAQVLAAAGGAVALVDGAEALAKLTFAEDFMDDLPIVRTGMGYDVHRLVAGEDLWLGGVRIDHDRGLSGHSDADVALHALTDALLGAVADGDIGSHFPPTDPRWRGAASDAFLRHAGDRVRAAGYAVGNVDLTIICEAPRIGPHRAAMRARIAALLDIDTAAVSVKATTTERLGFTGRQEGIAAQAIATVLRR